MAALARRGAVFVDLDALERLVEVNTEISDLAAQEAALTLPQRARLIGLSKDFIEYTQQTLGLTKETSRHD